MRLLPVLLAMLTVGTVPAPARAQVQGDARATEPVDTVIAAPSTVPGAVVSTVLQVQRPQGAAGGTYSVRPADQVLLYGAPEGDVAVRADAGLVPLTFSVPKETRAGTMHVARVLVRWADGTEWVADVQAPVVFRRGLALELDTTSMFVAGGTASRIGFVVQNLGNAPDTIRLTFLKPESWTLEAPGPLVLEAGESYVDSVRIRMPATAAYGETQIVRVTARGVGAEAARNLAVTVAERDVEEGGLLRLPATITVGAVDAGMLEETPVSVALEMQGSLGNGTEASLLVRRSPDAATPPAFYQYLTGPSLRAELRRGQDHLTAGDVLFTGSALHGGSAFGAGVDAEAGLGLVRAGVFAARPYRFDAPERPGHLLGAAGELTTTAGTFGVSASDMARPVGIVEETERSRLAALTYRGTLARGLSTRAEAGVMALRDEDGRTREGVAFDIETAWRGERFDLQGHVRRVPGSLATSGSAVDETYLGGAFDIGSGFSLNGWLVRSETELLDGGGTQHDGTALTARWTDGRATAQVSGYLRRTSGGGLLTGDTEQRSVSIGGAVPLGALTAEGTVELGRALTRDGDQSLRHITSRLSWQAGAAWAWLGLSHSQGVFGSDLTRVDAGSTIRAGRIELDGRIGSWLGSDAGGRVDAWVSGTVHVTAHTALIAGIDYTPWRVAADEIRVSLGARHSLGVPLPIRRRPNVQGTVFEDVNGNMRRDPGEPGIEGVRVRRGNTFAVSDDRGRYAFYSDRSAPAELSVDAGSLAHGLMLLPTEGIPARGTVDIPVVRAAALRLYVYEDRDRDGTRGMLEGAAAGAVIELTDDRGRVRTASADRRGTIAFAALQPGDYSARARLATGQQEAGAAVPFTLAPGETTSVEIAAPRHMREIRFGVAPDTVREDTVRVDTVTVIPADDDADRPIRSDTALRRPPAATPAPTLESTTGTTSSREAAPATAPDTASPPAAPQVARRTGYAVNGGWIIGFAALGTLLVILLLRRRRGS